MSDPTSLLPARPSLEHLRKQAKELLRDYKAGAAAAVERFRARIIVAGGCGLGGYLCHVHALLKDETIRTALWICVVGQFSPNS